MPEENKKELLKKYHQKGFQTLTIEQYHAHKRREAKLKQLRVHPYIKWIIYTPFVVIFCFGLLFLPFISFLVLSQPSSDGHLLTDKTPTYQSRSKKSRSKR